MAELHARDLRNRATPVHQPVVQHVDYLAAEDEGMLDEALTDEPEGDAAHAVESAEHVEEQEAALSEMDEPVADNTEPEGGDEDPALNAFGNAGPEGTMEDDAEAQGDFNPLTAQGVGEGVTPAEPVTSHDDDSDDDDSDDE